MDQSNGCVLLDHPAAYREIDSACVIAFQIVGHLPKTFRKFITYIIQENINIEKMLKRIDLRYLKDIKL